VRPDAAGYAPRPGTSDLRSHPRFVVHTIEPKIGPNIRPRGEAMNPTELMRGEVLRLRGSDRSGRRLLACVEIQLFTIFWEKNVRRELASLAAENRIKLFGWDGREARPPSEWPNAEEFSENSPEVCRCAWNCWTGAFRKKFCNLRVEIRGESLKRGSPHSFCARKFWQEQ